MLLARCFLRLSPFPRDGWHNFLTRTELLQCPASSYTTSQQKPPRTIKSQKTIVRVNGRKVDSATRPSSSQVPPPAPPPRAQPTHASPPAPSASKPLSNYVIGVVAAAGIAGGAYYFMSNTSKSESPQKAEPKKPAVTCIPPSISEIPDAVQYLLVGGGTASFAAFRAIKSNDPKAQVLVLSEEDWLPYMRPPLSKELWRNKELHPLDQLTFQQWNGKQRSIYYESEAFYTPVNQLTSQENGGVAVARGYTATRVDPAGHEVTISAPGQPEKTIKYGKCLYATGVRPRNISVMENAEAGVHERAFTLRTMRDAERLWRRLDGARDVIVVGGGFLGSEMACALAGRERAPRVTQVFRERGNLGHVLPEYLAAWTSRQLAHLGVDVLPNTEIRRAYMKGNRVALEMMSGDTVEGDVVVVGGGSTPNTEVAARSGLELDSRLGGVLVNAELQSRTDLYAAGDVACFFDPLLGRRRVEHHDHAVVSGRLAGENMAGAAKHFAHQSMFWSDLGPDIGLEAIGLIDSTLPTVAVFAEIKESPSNAENSEAPAVSDKQSTSATHNVASASPNVTPAASASPNAASASPNVTPATKKDPEDVKYEKGVVFYMQEKRIVGVLMWNLFNRMSLARQLVTRGDEYDDLNEVAKLFRIHE